MVSKLQRNEYLRRYDNMTAGERRAYDERVGEWLQSGAGIIAAKTADFSARLQNVQQVSTTWNDRECQAFEEGARLLSALACRADTWLPDMLYAKSAKRAAERIRSVLEEHAAAGALRQSDPEAPAGLKPEEETAPDTYTVMVGSAVSVGAAAGTGQTDTTVVKPEVMQVCVELPVPARPKHIDQYVHLLPVKTQEKAATVKDLLREMDDAREKMRLLADDPTAKDDDRAAWAKKATGIDNALRKIYDELDAEWAKLVRSGRVTVDDLGNARVMEDGRGKMEDGAAADDQPSEVNQELTSEQKARRRELRKWLVDTRRGNGDTREEYVKKWQDNFREYLTLEGDAAYKDEKIRAAATHYALIQLFSEQLKNGKDSNSKQSN